MSKVTFIIKEKYNALVSLANDGTLSEFVDTKFYKLPKNEYTTDTKICVGGELITDHTIKFCEIKMELLTINLFGIKAVSIISERSSSITKYLTEEELDEPIIKYLSDKNIIRGCWTCDGMCVNVKNKFNDYENGNQ